MTFTYKDNQFLLDGKPYRILSGANQIIVFETDGFDSPVITFTDSHDLG